jgi:penicillin-binding protein A
MPLFRSRRRLVNRRRRHGWLTPRGRVSLAISVTVVGLGLLAGLLGPAAWRARDGFEALIPSPGERTRDPAPARPDDRPDSAADTLATATAAPPPGSVTELPISERPEVSAGPSLSGGPDSETSSDAAFENIEARVEGPFFDPPRSRERFELARSQVGMVDPLAAPKLSEWRDPAEGDVMVATPGRVRVEYSLDEALTERVFEILRRGRVSQGHAIVLDPRSGRLLAYVSTDEEGLPAEKAYPAASIVKILTASAVLEGERAGSDASCIYRGNKYRLNRRRLEPPQNGRESSLESALASSNNQCFARWALHSVGESRLRETLARFGWLTSPAPGHEAGQLEPLETDLDLGRLGSGLDGVRVTPLHVAQIASILTHGEWVEPWWIDRVVDAYGRPLHLQERRPNRPVLSREVADRLRSMLVATTKRGTAKSAFRDRRGRPRVGSINVAGKTGNLTGWDPYGRYEWFLGLAPAEDPTIGVVVLQLQGHMWWRRSTELASDVLRAVFCDKAGCRPEHADRLTAEPEGWTLPQLISQWGRPRVEARPE